MLIFIDRQHAGKPKRPSDRGAGQDLDGDGKVSWWEKEAIWTGKLSIELEILLLEMGYDVLPISDGSYQTRHARVNNYAEGKPVPPPSDFYLLDDSGDNLLNDDQDYLVTP